LATGQKVKRIIHVNKVAEKLGLHNASAQLGLHAFTGCDSVSSFYGRGKVKAWKVMEEEKSGDTFISLGRKITPSREVILQLESFTCALYSQKECTSVNEARYRIFKLHTKTLESGMPPNQDSLHKHVQRAHFQAAIWRRSLIGNMEFPSPAAHGWKIEDDNLVIDWMDLAPAPEEILELTHCNCKKAKCENRQCSCVAHGMSCTDLCSCINCVNQVHDSDDEDNPSDSDKEVEINLQ